VSAPDGPTRVGIGLIARAGRYLVRQRPPGAVMAGVWEFPGGKCERGESPEAATLRECREETGCDVTVERLRRVVSHRYPHGWIELSFFDCTLADGAEPADGAGFVWVEAAALQTLTFPGANETVLAELGAPAAGS
jgi:mutator protein MutT